MVDDSRYLHPEEVGHLPLGEPEGLILVVDLDPHLALGGLVEDEVAVGGACLSLT